MLWRLLLVVSLMWYYSQQATRLMNRKSSQGLKAHTVVKQRRALKRKLYAQDGKVDTSHSDQHSQWSGFSCWSYQSCSSSFKVDLFLILLLTNYINKQVFFHGPLLSSQKPTQSIRLHWLLIFLFFLGSTSHCLNHISMTIYWNGIKKSCTEHELPRISPTNSLHLFSFNIGKLIFARERKPTLSNNTFSWTL